MSTLRSIYYLARADLLERTRRYSFLVTIGLMVLAVYNYLPSAGAGYLTLGMGHYRGIYNSAWIGTAAALLTSALLSLPAFYLVKNTLALDKQTGVGEILATTPLTRPLYTCGKALSNFIFLAVAVGIVVVAAAIIQLIRAEELRIEPLALVAPFVLIVLPTMVVVAAIAVLFETVSWLSGILGNILYFFLWFSLLTTSLGQVRHLPTRPVAPATDVFGVAVSVSSMMTATKVAFPDYAGVFSLGGTALEAPVRTFLWEGIFWSPSIIVGRLAWVGVALGGSLLAALFFDRFDPARGKQPYHRITETLTRHIPGEEMVTPSAKAGSLSLAALDRGRVQCHWGSTLWAELRMAMKSQRWWWYAVAIAIIGGTILLPLEVARPLLFPAAWLWPLPVWSRLGRADQKHHTEQIVVSAPHPLRRQVMMAWLVGVIVAVATGLGISGTLMTTGDWPSLLVWGTAALFIPALALALGIWSGSGKPFEVVYVVLWYVGPVSRIPGLDFSGASTGSEASGALYLAAAVGLLGMATLGRWRQVRT